MPSFCTTIWFMRSCPIALKRQKLISNEIINSPTDREDEDV